MNTITEATFITRYKNAIREYFGYRGDDEGRTIKNYIMTEYEKILEEEFDMKEEDIRNIYNSMYKEFYGSQKK